MYVFSRILKFSLFADLAGRKDAVKIEDILKNATDRSAWTDFSGYMNTTMRSDYFDECERSDSLFLTLVVSMVDLFFYLGRWKFKLWEIFRMEIITGLFLSAQEAGLPIHLQFTYRHMDLAWIIFFGMVWSQLRFVILWVQATGLKGRVWLMSPFSSSYLSLSLLDWEYVSVCHISGTQFFKLQGVKCSNCNVLITTDKYSSRANIHKGMGSWYR